MDHDEDCALAVHFLYYRFFLGFNKQIFSGRILKLFEVTSAGN